MSHLPDRAETLTMTGQHALTAFDTLVGCRVGAIGRPGGSARLAAGLLADLGADVELLDTLAPGPAGDGRWDVVVVDDPGDQEWADLGTRARRLLCAVDSVPVPAPVVAQSDLVAQAAAGHLLANGEADDPPIPCGAPVAGSAGALGAVLCVVAGWFGRAAAGSVEEPDRVRVSQVDVLLTFLTTVVPHYLLTGHDLPRIGNRHALTAPWNVYPASDGWVVMATMGERQWLQVSDTLGEPLLAEDPRFATAELRILNVEALDEAIGERTCQLSKQDLVKAAEECGVPLAEVLPAGEAGRHPQVRHRQQVAQQLGAERLFFRGLAGDTGPGRPRTSRGSGGLPLEGVRVLEVGLYTAGPVAGRLLALLGADVLKVEPPQGEPGRQLGSKIGDSSYLYFMNNTDKRACVLDLKTPDGRRSMHELVRDCDVFLTNLSEEAMTAAGLDFDSASLSSPGVVYCSISGYGASGPFRGRRVLDAVIQAVSGIMDVTGRADGPPLKTAASTCDLVAAWVAALSVVAALGDSARDRGESQLLDVSLLDAATWLMRGLPRGTRGRPARRGAHDPAFEVHGVFEAADATQVALAVRDEQAWSRLTGRAGLGVVASPEQAVRRWVEQTPSAEVLAALSDAGVPGAAVLRPSEAAGRLLVELPLDRGTHRVFGSPVSWPARDVRVRTRAPGLGQHDAVWLADAGIERRGA